MAKKRPSATSMTATVGALALTAMAAVLGLNATGDSDTTAQVVPTPGTETSISTSDANFAECPLDTLPAEARATADDIRAGGPYAYPDNDNTRFGNYEGTLPDQQLGYYREYTVDTPGLHHRGARRIVTGGGTATDPDVWYYTDDHYDTFCEIPDAE